MDCSDLVFSGHALQRMFARGISAAEVDHVVRNGEAVQEYLDDSPYPSYLLLGFCGNRWLHVVAARDESIGRCIVITAYVPDRGQWDTEFRKRRGR